MGRQLISNIYVLALEFPCYAEAAAHIYIQCVAYVFCAEEKESAVILYINTGG